MTMTGQEIEKPKAQLTAGAKLPAAFSKVINLEAWARAVAYGEPYDEPNPDFISRMLALLTITGETAEEVFENAGVIGLQKKLPDTPGASTGPLEITDLYVAKSDFETGNQTYTIISGHDLTSGEDFKTTTGATNVQATLIGLLKLGHWPIRCQFKRGDTKDKGGKYLIFMLPPD